MLPIVCASYSGMGQAHQYCVVEVYVKPQLHLIEVSDVGAFPNPLTVCPGDCVCWKWDDVYDFGVEELTTQSIIGNNGRYYIPR